MTTKSRMAYFIASTLVPVLLCHAQNPTPPRNLTGTVADKQHEPLKGAVVQLQNENDSSVVSYITDRDGHYTFKRLSGTIDYHIWASYRGHMSKHKELSRFNSKLDPKLDLVISLH